MVYEHTLITNATVLWMRQSDRQHNKSLVYLFSYTNSPKKHCGLLAHYNLLSYNHHCY